MRISIQSGVIETIHALKVGSNYKIYSKFQIQNDDYRFRKQKQKATD